MKNRFGAIALIVSISFMAVTTSCKKDKNDSPSEAKNLYFTYYDNNSVNKIDLINTPNAVTTLFDTGDTLLSPEGIALTNDGFIIVTEEGGDRILKMRKNGTGSVIVLYDQADGINIPTAVAVDNATGTIYWCNSGSGQLMRGSDDGQKVPDAMFEGQAVLNYAYGLAIDKNNKKIYIGDFNEFIKVGNLDGTGTMDTLYSNVNFTDMVAPSNIFVDAGHKKIYWTDESADQVVVANLDGTGNAVVLFDASDGVNRPDGISVDYGAGKIYWSETSSNVIARGNLDGTGTREVLVDNVQPYGIALE